MALQTDLKAWYAEVGQRLREVIVGRMGFDRAAEVADVSKSTLRRYGDGEQCPFHVVVALADASGKPLDWFAGRGSSLKTPDTVDMVRLAKVIDLIETWLRENRRVMTPEKKAEVIALAYEIVSGAQDNAGQKQAQDNVIRLLRVAS